MVNTDNNAPAPVETFKVSIVIPAYNEQAVIEATINSLYAALQGAPFDHEIRVVDDRSTDATLRLLKQLSAQVPTLRTISNPSHGGYGMAVRAGLATFEGDAVIISMADGSDAPSDILAYGQALQQGYDCAFGTRFSGTTQVQDYPLVKKMLNRCANRLIAIVTGYRHYDDFTNGFKGYRRHCIQAMEPLVCADFNLTVEMSIKAVLSKPSVKIIPNSWRDREGGESKFNLLRLGPRYLLTIVYCFLQRYLRQAGARARPPGQRSISGSPFGDSRQP